MPRRNPPNARRFKKGEVHNPNGSSRKARIMAEAKRLTTESYNDLMNFILHADKAALKKVAEDPKESGLRITAAQTMLKAMKDKNFGPVDDFVSRVIGRIPVKTEIVRPSPFDGLTLKELEEQQKLLTQENQSTLKQLEDSAAMSARDVTDTTIKTESA